jgi:hypothetical protein
LEAKKAASRQSDELLRIYPVFSETWTGAEQIYRFTVSERLAAALPSLRI